MQLSDSLQICSLLWAEEKRSLVCGHGLPHHNISCWAADNPTSLNRSHQLKGREILLRVPIDSPDPLMVCFRVLVGHLVDETSSEVRYPKLSEESKNTLLLFVLPGHTDRVLHLAMSPASASRLFSAGADERVHVWSL